MLDSKPRRESRVRSRRLDIYHFLWRLNLFVRSSSIISLSLYFSFYTSCSVCLSRTFSFYAAGW